jgi:chromosome segregation ATPase
MALALLNKDIDPLRQAVTASDSDVTKAMENLSSAQKALEQAKNDAAAIPATITKLRAAVDEAVNRTAKARAAADKMVATADKPVAVAQAKVDAIAKDYEALCRESQAANPPMAELTKK